MQDEDYAKYIKKNLLDFWKPGQRLEITGSFRANPKARIHCALCEWPRTSKNPTTEGLINVLVLKNLDTGAWRFIGSVCAEHYQSYLQTIDPNFEIAGIKEAKQRLLELQNKARQQSKAQRPSPKVTSDKPSCSSQQPLPPKQIVRSQTRKA